MRRGIQLFSLILFALLFVLSPLVEKLTLPPDLFLKADPLLGISAVLASRRLLGLLLWSLPVLLSAFVAGRFFCGWLCPLGTCFELCSTKKAQKKNPVPKKAKFYLLLFLLAAAACTVNIAGIFDPIALITRAFTIILYPLTMLGAATGLEIFRPAADYLSLITLSHAQVHEPVFSLLPLTVIVMLALFVLNYTYPRFWCRSLCPLGALLGVGARLGFFRRRVTDGCTSCMKCARDCPAGALGQEPREYDPQECICCLKCGKICPAHAVDFSPGTGAAAGQTDMGRRGLLTTAAAGALTAFAITKDTAEKVNENRLIRPPGALPESLFQGTCIRCGQCMKICPTNTLQPCLFEAGIAGIWSPRLKTRLAGCDQTCSLCGTVCPTGAIRELTLDEKKHAKLGTASLDRNRCLVWAQDRLCLICDEQCPYNAIVFKWKDGMRRPIVIDTKCNGCGFCEQVCPVQGRSAIEVSQHGEIRLAEGSYIEKARELQLEFKNEPGDDAFIQESEQPESASPQKLPEGIRAN